MTEIRMRVTCVVEPTGVAVLEDDFDRTADAFYGLPQISDQSVEYNSRERRMVFDMIFDAEDQLDAVHRGYGFVRSAIHAAGGHTPGWEDSVRAIAHDVSESKPQVAQRA